MSEEFVKVGPLSDFPAGSQKKIQVGQLDVLVANVAGNIYAIGDTCTHRGCSLSDGTIEANVVTCPCHAGRFDLTTGKVIVPPPRVNAVSFEVRLQGSDVLLKKR